MKTDLFRNPNAGRLVELIREKGAVNRSMVSKMLDISDATVTRLTNQMLKKGVLEETPDQSRVGKKGFPSKLLFLPRNGLISAGVFIEPDKIQVGIFDTEGSALSEEIIPVVNRSFSEMVSNASGSLKIQMSDIGLSPKDLIGCGISYPGQHTASVGQVLKTDQLALWPSIDFERDLAPHFDMPIFHMNDGKVAALAELGYGACRGVENFCYVWLSYGIGGAAVIDRNLHLGSRSLVAEFGGIFPKSHSRPSGQDLLNTLNEAGFEYARLENIPDEMMEHEVVAKWILRASEQIQWLCLVIARTIAPNAIVLGGSLSTVLIDRIHTHLSQCEILGEDYLAPKPTFIRAETDKKPHLGAASIPLYYLTRQ